MSTSTITVRLDAREKEQFEEIVNDLGLNMATAISAFVKTVIREEGIPFMLFRKKDSFYSVEELETAALKDIRKSDKKNARRPQ